MSSGSFLGLRPPPAPPPEPPSPPTPPEPPDPPDLQICHSSSEVHAQPLIFQHLTCLPRILTAYEPPSPPPSRLVLPCRRSIPPSIGEFAPRQSSRRTLHIPRSANVKLGFYRLGHNCVICLLGQKWMDRLLGQKWMDRLLGQKWTMFLLGLTIPKSSPLFPLYQALSPLSLCFKSSQSIKDRRLFSCAVSRAACSFSGSVTMSPIPFLQVCSSYLLSRSSTVGNCWMSDESVALALWKSGITITPSMFLDSLRSNFMLSSGTLIALVRNLTAVCRFYFELALLEASLWQVEKRQLLSFTDPDFLVNRDFHSPHLSVKELFILPNTSLVFSGIVIGSIVVKIVLLRAEARIVVQDGSRSAIADLLTLEALFPPSCGFGKDYRVEAFLLECYCLDSVLVELVSSPLSLSLYLSLAFNFSSCLITLLVVVFAALVPCRLSVCSFNGG